VKEIGEEVMEGNSAETEISCRGAVTFARNLCLLIEMSLAGREL